MSDFALAAGTGSAFCLALTRQIETCHVDSNDKTGDLRNKQKRHPLKVASSRSMHKLNCTSDRDVVTRTNSARDVKVGAPGILSSRNRDDSSSCFP